MRNDLNEKFINKANKIHSNRYDYSKVIYVNSSNKVIIICNIHGEFLQSPNKHLNKRGCPKCANRNILNTEEVIKRFVDVHGDRYDYSEVVFKNVSKAKVNIICKEHGLFEQRVDHHISGQNCNKCRIDSIKITKHDFLNKLEDKFPEHYSQNFEYEGFQKETEIICLITKNKLRIIPKKFLLLKKCPCCFEKEKLEKLEKIKNKPKGITNKLSQEDFLNKVKKVHGDKYDYTNTIYIKHKEKIEVFCKKEGHGKYSLTANHHLKGVGCPKCKESKGESKIRLFLIENNIIFETQKMFTTLNNKKSRPKFDFYLPNYNICIEYDGKQHFEPIDAWGGYEEFLKIVTRDKIKNKFCEENNMKLLRISYLDYDNIEKIIIDNLNLVKNF